MTSSISLLLFLFCYFFTFSDISTKNIYHGAISIASGAALSESRVFFLGAIVIRWTTFSTTTTTPSV